MRGRGVLFKGHGVLVTIPRGVTATSHELCKLTGLTRGRSRLVRETVSSDPDEEEKKPSRQEIYQEETVGNAPKTSLTLRFNNLNARSEELQLCSLHLTTMSHFLGLA